MELIVPPEYGYVILTVVLGSFFVNMFLVFNLGKARKRFNVQYPTVYSPDNKIFNCYQRAHQNYLEVLPFFMATALLAGLSHPLLVSAFNVTYLLGRVVYALGYYTGDAAKRNRGFFGYIGFFGNIILSVHTALIILGVQLF